MFDFARYRPIAVVAGGLLTVLVVLNLLLLKLAGPRPIWSKESLIGWEARNTVGADVAGMPTLIPRSSKRHQGWA